MLRIRPSLTTAKSVPLIGLSAPSGPSPQGEADMVAEAVGLADQVKAEIAWRPDRRSLMPSGWAGLKLRPSIHAMDKNCKRLLAGTPVLITTHRDSPITDCRYC